MGTVRDLIAGSMRLIGAIATGETPAASEQADGLVALNDMLDSWSTEGLTVFDKVREEFSLVANQASYTMGVAGNFNTSRPLRIENAGLILETSTPEVETPIRIINQDEWAAISQKDLTSDYPTRLYIEWANPLAVLFPWPVPTAANSLALYSWKPLTAFAGVATSVAFPPGYAKALRYCLALELAPEFGKQIDPAVVQQAMDSKENIKRMNIKPNYLSCDPGTLNNREFFNILTGE